MRELAQRSPATDPRLSFLATAFPILSVGVAGMVQPQTRFLKHIAHDVVDSAVVVDHEYSGQIPWFAMLS